MINNIPVIFNMASMPSRIPALEESIPRMLLQCDELHIYLNEYPYVPEVLNDPRIILYHSDDHLGDLGDVGKFFNAARWTDREAYIFTVDDKILYPPDYAQKAVEAIEEYQRKAVVAFHGRNLKKNCSSYYFDFAEFFLVYGTVLFDTFAHELGTGAMAFHSDTVPAFNLSIFPAINMTDIWFSMFLQKKQIPILIRRHQKGWIRMSRRHDDNYSIHAQCNQNDAYQTQVVNGFDWKIHRV